MFMYILISNMYSIFLSSSWIDSSKQVFFNIKSNSSVYGNNVSTACYYLDYSASNNNWFIPLFTPLHVIKHCPYWSLLILMFKHFFVLFLHRTMFSGGALDSGSGLKVVESEVVWELILCMYNITHMFHPSLPPPPLRPDCSGSGSGLRIKFKVGREWGSMRVNIIHMPTPFSPTPLP